MDRIWKRVAELVAPFGLRAEQVDEVVDFYWLQPYLNNLSSFRGPL